MTNDKRQETKETRDKREKRQETRDKTIKDIRIETLYLLKMSLRADFTPPQ